MWISRKKLDYIHDEFSQLKIRMYHLEQTLLEYNRSIKSLEGSVKQLRDKEWKRIENEEVRWESQEIKCDDKMYEVFYENEEYTVIEVNENGDILNTETYTLDDISEKMNKALLARLVRTGRRMKEK